MMLKIFDFIADILKIEKGWAIGHYGMFSYTFYRFYYILGKRFTFESKQEY
jgi:hypothetical protein